MRRASLLALTLLAGGWALTLWVPPWSNDRVNDLFVYRSFAAPVLDGALPYREAFFEYPPLAAPAIALPGVLGTGEDSFRLAFAGWTLLLAATVVLLCGVLAERTGGDRRRALLAAAPMPLLCGALLRTHFDLAPVAITLVALVLLSAERPRSGLAVLGLGAMVKGFPLVVVPVALAWLVARGRRREAWQGAAALAAVVALLAAAAVAVSPDGALHAVRYHLERPVQIESTPALVLRALDGVGAGAAVGVSSHRSDALVHPADALVSGVLGVVLALILALLAALAARRPGRRELVLASLAAVTAFALLGKVLSPQFVTWVLPLGALAVAWRMDVLAVAVAAGALLTQVVFPARYLELVARDPFPVAVVALRNAALLAVLLLALNGLRRSGSAGRGALELGAADAEAAPAGHRSVLTGEERGRGARSTASLRSPVHTRRFPVSKAGQRGEREQAAGRHGHSRAGAISDSIDVARPDPSASIRTAFNQGSSSAVSKRT